MKRLLSLQCRVYMRYLVLLVLCVAGLLVSCTTPTPIRIVLLFDQDVTSTLGGQGQKVVLKTQLPGQSLQTQIVTDKQALSTTYTCPSLLETALPSFEVEVMDARGAVVLVGLASLTRAACEARELRIFLSKPNTFSLWRTWSQQGGAVENTALPLVGHKIVSLPSGRLLVIGGASTLQVVGGLPRPDKVSAALWLFDSGSGEWTKSPVSLRKGRAFHSVVRVSNAIYVLGGWTPDGCTASIEKIDILEDGTLRLGEETTLTNPVGGHHTFSSEGASFQPHTMGGYCPGVSSSGKELQLLFHTSTLLKGGKEVLVLGGLLLRGQSVLRSNSFGWVVPVGALSGSISVRLSTRPVDGGVMEQPVLVTKTGDIWPTLQMKLPRAGHSTHLLETGALLVVGGYLHTGTGGLFSFQALHADAAFLSKEGEEWRVSQPQAYTKQGDKIVPYTFQPRALHGALSYTSGILIAGGIRQREGLGGTGNLSPLLVRHAPQLDRPDVFFVDTFAERATSGRFWSMLAPMPGEASTQRFVLIGGIGSWTPPFRTLEVASRAYTMVMTPPQEIPAIPSPQITTDSWFIGGESHASIGHMKVVSDRFGDIYTLFSFEGTLTLFGGKTFSSSSGRSLMLLKWSKDGTFLWSERLTDSLATGDSVVTEREPVTLSIDPDGMLLVSFVFSSRATLFDRPIARLPERRILLARLDPLQKKALSVRAFRMDGGIYVLSLIPGAQSYWLSGVTRANGRQIFDRSLSVAGEKMFLARVRPAAQSFVVEALHIAKGDSDEVSIGLGLAVEPTGALYVLGLYTGVLKIREGGLSRVARDLDMFVMKLTDKGVEWAQGWGGTGRERAISLKIEEAGPVIAGVFVSDFSLPVKGTSFAVKGADGGWLFLAGLSKASGEVRWFFDFAQSERTCPGVCEQVKAMARGASGDWWFGGALEGTYSPFPGVPWLQTQGVDAFLLQLDKEGRYRRLTSLGDPPLSRPYSQQIEDMNITQERSLLVMGRFEGGILGDRGVGLHDGGFGLTSSAPYNFFVWKRRAY
ncbi:MAG: hypothetical protein CL920_39890 [Deltaproteobacteria bacterium]|nr:hypothetical protein [Deltaproteobacteria bacterium]MBU54898.1 hypothetical protein [Deltaproteobacteria bacterium]